MKQGMQACKWEYGPCQLLNSSATCGVGKKLGTAQNQNCPVTEKQLKCKISCGCKYKPVRDGSASTGCDRDAKKKEIKQELISGDPQSCPKTKSVYRKCRMPGNNKNSRGSREVRPGSKKNGEGRAGDRKRGSTMPPETDIPSVPAAGKNACKYKKGVKSECDPLTKKRTVTLELKKKSPATCPPTKTIQKECKVKVKGERPNRKGSNFF
jgi:hypothetical protein